MDNNTTFYDGNLTAASSFSPAFVAIVSIVMVLLSAVTVVGNFMVLMSFYLDKNIRQPTNYYIFSLAVSDLVIGMEGFPLFSVLVLHGSWPLGYTFCDIWLVIDYSVCLASIYTVLCITIDRYCSVKIPAAYRNWRSKEKTLFICAIIWLVPTALFSVMIFGWNAMTNPHPGDIRADSACFVQFMTNKIVNMSMYIGYTDWMERANHKLSIEHSTSLYDGMAMDRKETTTR